MDAGSFWFVTYFRLAANTVMMMPRRGIEKEVSVRVKGITHVAETNVFIHSHCGDSPHFLGQKESSLKCKPLHFRVMTWFNVKGVGLG